MQQPHFASQITQNYNVYVNPYGMRRLSPLFQPGSFDVLCARGKLAYDHEGNRRFRALVKQHRKQYSAANCKYEKSKIVSFIVSAVRNASPNGGFVKHIDGHWFEVGDRHAKEKVGQTFRDLLHNKYSSSTKAKARARMQRRIKDNKKEDGKESKKNPDTVPSRSPSSKAEDDDMRSSVSVVSNGSADVGVDSDAKTVVKSNKGLPPLRSVIVNKEAMQSTSSHPGQQYLPQVSPPLSLRAKSANLETLRNSLARPPMAMGHDLEPLPLRASVKVNFNDSNSTIQSEESFEDVMSEFCQNMGVAV